MTAAQRRTLELIRDGRPLHLLTGRDPSAFIALDRGAHSVNLGTFFAIQKRGWIEQTATPVSGRRYGLSPAGRRALEERADG